MNSLITKALARKHTPLVKPIVLQDHSRFDIARLLQGNSNIGIELGVAAGGFSKAMIQSKKFKKYFGVDLYAGRHDTQEYRDAIIQTGLENNFLLIRMKFAEAIDIFPDEYFDFIYVDGFAHTGENGGTTLFSWFRKLKPGGLIAGDDYHSDWPLVVWAVNEIAIANGEPLLVTGTILKDKYSAYPTWAIRKQTTPLKPDQPSKLLSRLGKMEELRVGLLRRAGIDHIVAGIRKAVKMNTK